MTAMSISIPPEIAALLGAAVGAIPSLIAAKLNARAREREQVREIAIRAAIENWRLTAEHARAVLPLEHYIIHAAKMTDLAFADEKLTPSQIADRLKEIDALMDALARKSKPADRAGDGA
jgi:type II secretory pathway pseudopilin PulG